MSIHKLLSLYIDNYDHFIKFVKSRRNSVVIVYQFFLKINLENKCLLDCL
jgi:hypothetical protein